jgi:hypothetical protein
MSSTGMGLRADGEAFANRAGTASANLIGASSEGDFRGAAKWAEALCSSPRHHLSDLKNSLRKLSALLEKSSGARKSAPRSSARRTFGRFALSQSACRSHNSRCRSARTWPLTYLASLVARTRQLRTGALCRLSEGDYPGSQQPHDQASAAAWRGHMPAIYQR